MPHNILAWISEHIVLDEWADGWMEGWVEKPFKDQSQKISNEDKF